MNRHHYGSDNHDRKLAEMGSMRTNDYTTIYFCDGRPMFAVWSEQRNVNRLTCLMLIAEVKASLKACGWQVHLSYPEFVRDQPHGALTSDIGLGVTRSYKTEKSRGGL